MFQRQGNRWQPLGAADIGSTTDLSAADGPLWVASGSGLRVVGTDPPPPPREPRANFFFDMTQTADGHLWVASVPKDNLPAYGLYEFDGEGWTIHNTKTNLSSATVSAVETDGEGLLWVGHWGRGIDVRDATASGSASPRLTRSSKALTAIPMSPSATSTAMPTACCGSPTSAMGWSSWMGGRPNGPHSTASWPLAWPRAGDMTKIALGPDGLKWIGTALDGFFLLDDGGTPFATGDETGQVFDTVAYPSLTSNAVSDIHVDRSGQVWVATQQRPQCSARRVHALRRAFEVANWEVYNTDNGLPSTATTALAEDDRGRIWVGTEGGLARIDAEGRVEFALDTSDGLVNNRVNSLYFGP